MRASQFILAAWLAAPLAAGCARPNRGPEIASSAGEANYAQTFPTELQATVSRFDERQRDGRRLGAAFSTYPDQLKDPNKAQVLAIIESADQAGRGQGYAERMREQEDVAAFFESEKDEINKKVGGAAAFAAKQKGCTADVYGPVSHSLKEAVDKQLEKRLRERNEAQALIERNRTSLGKQNAAALEKQADEISRASYLVYVDLIDKRNRAQRMLEEADRVKRTADDFIEKERAFQAEAGRADGDKKASEERIAAMTRSKASIDQAAEKAKAALPEMDKQIKASQKEYEGALDGLKGKFKK
jgi:molybdopterin-biosynthesis enzyme MoeA-like protein